METAVRAARLSADRGASWPRVTALDAVLRRRGRRRRARSCRARRCGRGWRVRCVRPAVPRARRFAAAASRVVAAGAAVPRLPPRCWGLNYQRQPARGRARATPWRPAAPEELAAACAELIAQAAALRAAVPRGRRRRRFGCADGVAGALARARARLRGLDDQLAGARRAAPSPAEARPALAGAGVPRHLGHLRPVHRRGRTSTRRCPSGRSRSPPPTRSRTSAGFAREDEANYLAYVSCTHHPDPRPATPRRWRRACTRWPPCAPAIRRGAPGAAARGRGPAVTARPRRARGLAPRATRAAPADGARAGQRRLPRAPGTGRRCAATGGWWT